MEGSIFGFSFNGTGEAVRGIVKEVERCLSMGPLFKLSCEYITDISNEVGFTIYMYLYVNCVLRFHNIFYWILYMYCGFINICELSEKSVSRILKLVASVDPTNTIYG